MHTYQALYLSPMIPSYNLKETANFFKSVLGFTPVLDTETYAVYQKNNLTIHILRAGEDIGQMEFYLEVDDVDSLWTSIKDKVEGLRVREPFDRDYGMREIHIEIPHTKTLLFIGQNKTKYGI
jgi:catechol 2,3-dioxygenase-like lactoylglutathione lyase family enzyme